MRDIVGLYLNPPEAAAVFCVAEKSQIQALDRSAPAATTAHAFNENLPLRTDRVVVRVNDVPGAIAIQDEIDRIEWVGQSGAPVAYAPHLRTAPLAGVPEKRVLFTFAQGDPVVRKPRTGDLLRAGDLADMTIYFRGLDAYAPNQPTSTDLHEFLFTLTPAGIGYAAAGQESVATFLASDGNTTEDPDGAGPLFETPMAGPLP